jgi:hypothetical protein
MITAFSRFNARVSEFSPQDAGQWFCGRLRQVLVGPAEASSGAAVLEDDVSSLQGDITEDVHANAGVGLETTKASGASLGQRRVGDVATGDGNLRRADEDVERRGASVAAQHVATLGGTVLGAGDLGVVLLDDGRGQVKKGRTGISNALDGGSRARSATNGITGSGECPVPRRSAHGGVCDLAGIRRSVDGAEFVSSSFPLVSVWHFQQWCE